MLESRLNPDPDHIEICEICGIEIKHYNNRSEQNGRCEQCELEELPEFSETEE